MDADTMRPITVFLTLIVLSLAAQAFGKPAAPATDYRFAPGDVIEVTVAPQHTFDRTVTVLPDGKISFPLVGQLVVAGLTVEQLSRKLQTALNQTLVDPVVNI